MKKTIVLIAGLAGLTTAVSAQKLSLAKVPTVVKASFSKAHPNVKKVSWEKEKNDYEAGFELKSQEVAEVYSLSGVLIESEVEIKVSDLPKEITAYISSHHKGQKIKEAAKITSTSGLVTYEAAVNGKDLIFDTTGTLIK